MNPSNSWENIAITSSIKPTVLKTMQSVYRYRNLIVPLQFDRWWNRPCFTYKVEGDSFTPSSIILEFNEGDSDQPVQRTHFMISVDQQTVYDEFKNEDFACPDDVVHELRELQNIALRHARGRQQSILRMRQHLAQNEQAAKQRKEEAIQSFYKRLVEHRIIELHALPSPPEDSCPVCQMLEALPQLRRTQAPAMIRAIPIWERANKRLQLLHILQRSSLVLTTMGSFGRNAVRVAVGRKRCLKRCRALTAPPFAPPVKPSPGTKLVLTNVPGFALLARSRESGRFGIALHATPPCAMIVVWRNVALAARSLSGARLAAANPTVKRNPMKKMAINQPASPPRKLEGLTLDFSNKRKQSLSGCAIYVNRLFAKLAHETLNSLSSASTVMKAVVVRAWLPTSALFVVKT
ncbi:uncharacterized protein EV420DRAFT_1651473 [Desarmillaria tabescens]|uniref:Uncharacterized protein n=1 Tax=Armillaria tabescens TaxID=1929756 RepID=A0AA39JCX3_ARMTA|nr:uncharacterized protein EV420DRAFT_1651473 [Desarmillaria tabescens]KAK0438328.1 hypothetical protein EV420DRAFT_1651473 [Desarmillaria tabescens]